MERRSVHDGPPPFTTNAAEQGIRPALAATVQGGSPRMVTSLVTSHAARPRNGHRRRPGHPLTAQFPHVSPGRCGGCPALPGCSGGWARPAARGAANSGKGSQAGPSHRRRPGGGKAAALREPDPARPGSPPARSAHQPARPHRRRTSRGPQRPCPSRAAGATARVRHECLRQPFQPAAHSPVQRQRTAPSGNMSSTPPAWRRRLISVPVSHARRTAQSAPPRPRSILHIRPASAGEPSARAPGGTLTLRNQSPSAPASGHIP